MPKGMGIGSRKSQFKKGQFAKEKHLLWKGGNTPQTRAKYAPVPKPDRCDVCGRNGKDNKKGLCYDHDHKTDIFRGWLCIQCNAILGLTNDNPIILQKLITYLSKQRVNQIITKVENNKIKKTK